MLLTEVEDARSGNHPVSDTAARRAALLELLRSLEQHDYEFVTPTPGTHTRIVSRPNRQEARALRDVLGWSLPFRREVVPDDVLQLLQTAGCVNELEDGRLKATVRVSSVRDTLFLHSAFPTIATDSVFLGPDSYRFADFIIAQMGSVPTNSRILDYGAGAGVGGITAARRADAPELTLADINPKALFLSSVNAEHAHVRHKTTEAHTPADVDGDFDLIVTHPPFMMDSSGRAYRDGGELYGGRLSLDWTLASIEKLRPNGKLILHTGISIVDGRDLFNEHLLEAVGGRGHRIEYRELDPDIFSEDLDEPAYRDVERIAAVGLSITRTGSDLAER